MKSASVIAAAAVLLLVGACGSDADSAEPADTTSTTTPSTSAPTTAETADTEDMEETSGTAATVGSGELTADDEAAITETIRTWAIDGGCDLMTDKFLEDQTFMDDRDEACPVFQAAVVEKLYTAEDLIISDFRGDQQRAKATQTSDIPGDFPVTYTLVNTGSGWQIDSVDF